MFITRIGAIALLACVVVADAGSNYDNTMAQADVAKNAADKKQVKHKKSKKAVKKTKAAAKAKKVKVSKAKHSLKSAVRKAKKDKKRVHHAVTKGQKSRAKAALKKDLKKVSKKTKALRRAHHTRSTRRHSSAKKTKKVSHKSTKSSANNKSRLASILRMGRKTWQNAQWTRIAVGSNKFTFKQQTAQANRALKSSVNAMRAILRNPRGKFSSTLLKQVEAKVAGAYRRSLRAQEAVLIAQGREMVGIKKMKLPHGVTSRKAVIKATKKAKKSKAKSVAKVVRKMRKLAKKTAAKSLKKSAHKKGKKAAKHPKKQARKDARVAVKKAVKKMQSHLVKKFGKKTAQHIIAHARRAAARAATVTVHKTRNTKETHALKKLKAVGGKVAHQITKEAMASGKSKKAAMHQGEMAGRAAVQYAAVLIKHQLAKKLGNKRTAALIKRVTKKANKSVHNVAAKRANKAKKAPKKKALGQVMADMMA